MELLRPHVSRTLTGVLGVPVLWAMTGCGAGIVANLADPGATVHTLTTAQWQMTATSSPGGAVVPVGLFLEVTGNAISGVANAQIAVPQVCGKCCGVPFSNLSRQISGSFDADGNIALKTAPFIDGSVLSITAQTSTWNSFSGGSYTISGGCFADRGTVAGSEIPPLNGTYAGTLTSVNTGKSYSVSAALGQTSTLDSRGYLLVTGSVKFVGYPCFSSATVDTGVENNGLMGGVFQATLDTPDPGGSGSSISGTISSNGRTIVLGYVAGGPGTGCALDVGQGTLTPQ